MRRRFGVGVVMLLIGAVCIGATQRGTDGSASPGDFAGIWAGTWEAGAAGSGGFELTLEKGKDGALGGRVSVTGEPTYKATLKTLSIRGSGARRDLRLSARRFLGSRPRGDVRWRGREGDLVGSSERRQRARERDLDGHPEAQTPRVTLTATSRFPEHRAARSRGRLLSAARETTPTPFRF